MGGAAEWLEKHQIAPMLNAAVNEALRARSSNPLADIGRKLIALSQQQSLNTAAALRIVHITDVYTLDNFPHLKTLLAEKTAEFESRYGAGAKTISVLTGDFLMPYLLSTLDKGKGMMNMLNQTPIHYVTWGNHEDDLGHADVLAREKVKHLPAIQHYPPMHQTRMVEELVFWSLSF